MITRQNLDGSRIATFSECDRYRYELLIRWDDSKPLVANIGLNPSTADEFVNDATVARDMVRASKLGFGSLLKLNLFPWRDVSPYRMKYVADPYGEWRDAANVIEAAERHQAQAIIAAWGNHGSHLNRANEMRAAAQQAGINLLKYKLNGTGEPCHPLYEPYSLQPTVYEYQVQETA